MTNDITNVNRAIANIDNSIATAEDCVMESFITLDKKYTAMEKRGMELHSEDELNQKFIENREEVILEYENEGPKKIYKKLYGMCNTYYPYFNGFYQALKTKTMPNKDIDMWLILRGTEFKSTIKKTRKENVKGAFNESEIKLIDNLEKCMDDFKKELYNFRTSRKFFDYWLYTRDTRSQDKILKVTEDATNALKSVLDMARKKFENVD